MHISNFETSEYTHMSFSPLYLYFLYLQLHMHLKPEYTHLSNFSPLLTLQPVPESLPVADHGSSAAAKAKAKVRIGNFCYLSFTSTTWTQTFRLI